MCNAHGEVSVRHVDPTATAAFLLRCARKPDRWYFPANAKAREPVCCAFTLCLARSVPGSVDVHIQECAYTEGGTGWRVWPCALLLAVWLTGHAVELGLEKLWVLELGCGLGLPGIVCAALGAVHVDVTDCLPRLLRCVRESIAVNQLEGRCRALMLDWDHEAPPAEVGGSMHEEFSTEQGIKASQLAEAESNPTQEDRVPTGKQSSSAVPGIESGTRFGLILASDVIYSFTHASQLPRVISQRLERAGRLCMMLPVRDQVHTRVFLSGLVNHGLLVLIERVDPDWTARVVATQAPQWKASIAALRTAPRAPESFGASTQLVEGEVLFVQAGAATSLL